MLIMKSSIKDGNLFIFGLSEKNVERLKAGEPAVGAIPDSRDEFMIVYGKTEKDIMDEFKKGGVVFPDVCEIRGRSGLNAD